MKLATLLCLGAVTFLTLSCGKEEPVAPTLPQVAKGERKITGRVTLAGVAPVMKEQLVTCDPGPGKPKIMVRDRTVRVSADGGLADVYVYVKNGPRGSGKEEPAVLLDQVECQFEPHALAVQIGQSVRLKNSDPAFHNAHWTPAKNSSENYTFTAAPSPEKVHAFTAAEFVPVRCDVHPWMKSSIGVFDNPFFAVTDEAGNFEIRHLPPGTYTVVTYHPFYGEGAPQQISVTDADGQASFSFK